MPQAKSMNIKIYSTNKQKSNVLDSKKAIDSNFYYQDWRKLNHQENKVLIESEYSDESSSVDCENAS